MDESVESTPSSSILSEWNEDDTLGPLPVIVPRQSNKAPQKQRALVQTRELPRYPYHEGKDDDSSSEEEEVHGEDSYFNSTAATAEAMERPKPEHYYDEDIPGKRRRCMLMPLLMLIFAILAVAAIGGGVCAFMPDTCGFGDDSSDEFKSTNSVGSETTGIEPLTSAPTPAPLATTAPSLRTPTNTPTEGSIRLPPLPAEPEVTAPPAAKQPTRSSTSANPALVPSARPTYRPANMGMNRPSAPPIAVAQQFGSGDANFIGATIVEQLREPSPRVRELQSLLSNITTQFAPFFYDPPDFDDPESPQNRAIEFLASEEAEFPNSNDGDLEPILQRYALMTLYFALGEPEQMRQVGFTDSTNVCNWKREIELDCVGSPRRSDVVGVFCDGPNVVETIRLPCSGLVGELPNKEFDLLFHLRTLVLDGNQIAGEPPTFQNHDLQTLSLRDNHFAGEISVFYLGMKSLRKLDLSKNWFTGGVPIHKWSAAPSLEILDLSENQLYGDIPDPISFRNLRVLRLGVNNFEFGDIPAVFSSAGLQELDLESTSRLGQLDNLYLHNETLVKLNLADNELLDNVTTFLSDFPKLEVVQLEQNDFFGDMRWSCAVGKARFESMTTVVSADCVEVNCPDFCCSTCCVDGHGLCIPR